MEIKNDPAAARPTGGERRKNAPSDGRELAKAGAELNLKEKRYRRRLFLSLLAAGLVVFVVCLLSGRYNCTTAELLGSLGHGLLERLLSVLNLPAERWGWWQPLSNPIDVTWGKDVDTVMWTVRMPRILAVILIGGGLSISGASFQCVFRNPLVSEGILGVSNGASLGAVLAIFFGLGPGLTSICAFAGGMLAVGLAYSCSKMFRGNPTLVLVLAGTVVGSLLTAGNSIVKYLAPQDTKLPQITFWLMGSFAGISWSKLRLMGPLIIICSLGILRMCWQLNLMALGDDEAKALGVDTARARKILIFLATVITSSAVCVCGIVGWVGMVIPQIVRLVVGPDARRLIPATFAVGAIFLMLVDIACRTLVVTEIPVGIITSLIGAPIFLVLLKRVKEGWA
ncbi:MAG: iron ABC transporter permease [Firmicutes bacterium]|nr:iron ABC transporter permease [Bacillota bacterium]